MNYEITLAETRDSNGNIAVSDYHQLLARSMAIVEDFVPTEIKTPEDFELAIKDAETMESVAKAIAKRRRKAIHAEMALFEEQCKTIEDIFKDKAKAYKAEMDKYTASHMPTLKDKVSFTIIVENEEEEKKLEALLKAANIKFRKEKSLWGI